MKIVVVIRQIIAPAAPYMAYAAAPVDRCASLDFLLSAMYPAEIEPMTKRLSAQIRLGNILFYNEVHR